LNIESFIIISFKKKTDRPTNQQNTFMQDELNFSVRVESVGRASPTCILRAKVEVGPTYIAITTTKYKYFLK